MLLTKGIPFIPLPLQYMLKGLIPNKSELSGLWFPLVFLAIATLVYALFGDSASVTTLGIQPRVLTGLQGILFAPFIHGSWEHLASNALPFAILGALLFTTYKEIAYKVFFLIYFLTGIWVWMFARDSYHIGASGVLYGLWSFILISGFLRRRNDLIVLSFFVAFLYGGMFWGLFPLIPHVSFESHISGMLAGIMCAIYYLRQGPQHQPYVWNEADELPDDPEAPWNLPDDEKENFKG